MKRKIFDYYNKRVKVGSKVAFNSGNGIKIGRVVEIKPRKFLGNQEDYDGNPFVDIDIKWIGTDFIFSRVKNPNNLVVIK